MINCPKCGVLLKRGETIKESDGTEATELYCPECKERYADIKMPIDVLFGGNESVAG